MAALAAVLSTNLSGCSKERVYESVYEGVRMQDEADRHPAQRQIREKCRVMINTSGIARILLKTAKRSNF